MPGLDALLHTRRFELVPELATYTTTASSTGSIARSTAIPLASHVRIVLELGYDTGGMYLDVGADGSDPHPLPLQIPCLRYLAITQDGNWGACWTAQGIVTFQLPTSAQSLSALNAPLEEHLALPLSAGQRYTYGELSWDPTGRYLAIARVSQTDSQGNGSPTPLDIYAISAQHDEARLALRLSGPLALLYIHWSPDGRWLLVSSITPHNGLFLLPLWQLAPNLPLFGVSAEYLTIAVTELRAISQGANWRSESGAAPQVTWVTNGLLSSRDLSTDQSYTVADLGFPSRGNAVGYICADGWTADGRQYAFALCDPGSSDIAGLPPKLFVYYAQSA